tara:strand:+ start:642 stop:1079 length:438 start_codon:yes stop_codon:yes gene_type:complete
MANFNKMIQMMRKKRSDTTSPKLDLHQHFAFFFTGPYKRSIRIIARGQNKLLPSSRSIHAEVDAARKISSFFKNKSINLFVGRCNMKLSKPCKHCVDYLMKMRKEGYSIKYIFYSDNDGEITQCKLLELFYGPQHYSLANKPYLE